MDDCYYRGQELEDMLNELDIENFEDGGGDDSGTYRKSARAMLFPSSFSGAAANMITPSSRCAECGTSSNLTLDHIESVSAWFNRKGYKCTREERKKWYNDTTNLRILCRSCNASKSGEGFKRERVVECYSKGLI